MALDKGWTNTVDDGVKNAEWDRYDGVIKAEIADYNARLAGTHGFATLDWQLFKAIVWVESGGPRSPAWTHRVMQIGNPNDQGYPVLLHGREASLLIMSPSLRTSLGSKINDPEVNIRAGIAYVLNRLAKSEETSVDDPTDTALRPYTVKPGDSLWAISAQKDLHTTVDALKKANPNVALHPGATLMIRRASVKRVITGWAPATPASVAQSYNGGGDPNYAAKLQYVLSLFPRLQRKPAPAAAPHH